MVTVPEPIPLDLRRILLRSCELRNFLEQRLEASFAQAVTPPTLRLVFDTQP
jgi:hypothetical protein